MNNALISRDIGAWMEHNCTDELLLSYISGTQSRITKTYVKASSAVFEVWKKRTADNYVCTVTVRSLKCPIFFWCKNILKLTRIIFTIVLYFFRRTSCRATYPTSLWCLLTRQNIISNLWASLRCAWLKFDQKL